MPKIPCLAYLSQRANFGGSMEQGFFVGAYAASPCHSVWDPSAEKAFLDGLANDKRIAGLELPFFGRLHRWDNTWLLKNLPKHWDHVLTLIPGTMEQIGKMSAFGLASADPVGRKASLAFVRAGLEAVQMLNEACGRRAVRAVEIHSAPTLGKVGVASSSLHFHESLREILSWDWQGAKLLIEHCDRWASGGPPPAKGFLSLEDEMEAILRLTEEQGQRAAVLVNWGRSAIEGRSVHTPIAHLSSAALKGVLGGLIFSGVTQADPLYGSWADSHAPFAAPSLMSREQVVRSLRACGELNKIVLGFKIQALPKTLTVAERIELVRGWTNFLAESVVEAKEA